MVLLPCQVPTVIYKIASLAEHQNCAESRQSTKFVQKIPVAIASDNVRDAPYPFGDHDMIKNFASRSAYII